MLRYIATARNLMKHIGTIIRCSFIGCKRRSKTAFSSQPRIVAMLSPARRRLARIAEWANQQITELNDQKDAMIKKLDEIKEKQHFYKEMVHAGRVASITVKGHIYRGVLLELCSLRTTIRQNDSFKKYFLEGGAICSSVIVL